MHRARARPMPPSSIARSRARMSSDVFLARRLVLLLVVVARPSSVDVDRVLARALARRARARVPRDERTNERRRSNDRTIDRTRATRRTLFFSAHPRRVRRVPRVGARALASSIHPSIHARARDRADPGSGSNRDRAHLLFLGRLRGARDDDASGASSGVRGRVDRARLARVRDRSSRREHRRCLPPARARAADTDDVRDDSSDHARARDARGQRDRELQTTHRTRRRRARRGDDQGTKGARDLDSIRSQGRPDRARAHGWMDGWMTRGRARRREGRVERGVDARRKIMSGGSRAFDRSFDRRRRRRSFVRPAGRTNERRRRRRSNDRSNARDPPDIIFLRASTPRSTRPSRRRARPRVIHPSIHPCARARSGRPWLRIESRSRAPFVPWSSPRRARRRRVRCVVWSSRSR